MAHAADCKSADVGSIPARDSSHIIDWPVAQLVERSAVNGVVAGSNPAWPANFSSLFWGGRSSPGRAPGCDPGGCGFESRRPPQSRFHRSVAQSGSAHAWGAWGRRFESCRSDQHQRRGVSSMALSRRRGRVVDADCLESSCTSDPGAVSSNLTVAANIPKEPSS